MQRLVLATAYAEETIHWEYMELKNKQTNEKGSFYHQHTWHIAFK